MHPNHDGSVKTVPQADRQALSRLITGRAGQPDPGSYSPGDWQALARMAGAEGVAPLLYWALSGAGQLGLLPGALAASLRAAYYGTRLRNQQLIRELGMLAQRLGRAGIPVVALKGICYALALYPDPGLRPMADLDLLVPASRLDEAVRIAGACGYKETVPEAASGLHDLLSHHACLQKTTAPYTTLELHDCLVANRSSRHAVPVGWFWSQVEPLAGAPGPNLLMLSPTAGVLYGAAHLMLQHGGRNVALRWLYDLDRLVRVYRDRIDWDTLLSQAREFQWGSALEAALSEAAACFETPVPADVLEKLRQETDPNAERVASLRARPGSLMLEEYQKLKSLDGHSRTRLLLALLVPSPGYMRWRYGCRSGWSLPGWYLYRWWFIFKDACKTAWLLTRKAVS